jgi:hypothetical protein
MADKQDIGSPKNYTHARLRQDGEFSDKISFKKNTLKRFL